MANTYDKASLVLIPSGTKEGVVFSQKPTNGDGDFTFSRSTAATRVNADGLIEKETQNLLTYSNTFDVSWSNSGDSIVSGQSGYDGSNDAWLFTTSASSQYLEKSQGVSGVQTFSVYAKSGTTDGIVIRFIGGANPYVFWNLSDGSYAGSGAGASIVARESVSVGNGWYRVSITMADPSTSVRIYCGDSSGAFASGNIYIQDAQLEEGLVARDYIETTTSAVYGGITDNVPRLDYTDSSCPALLLEPQRTNLVSDSENFISGSWSYAGTYGPNTTMNQAVSPEGVQNAALIAAAGAGNDRIQDNLGSQSNNLMYSIFVKSAGVDTRVKLRNSATNSDARWDVSAGGSVTFYSSTETNYGQENYGNGWYRVWFEAEADGSTTFFQFYPDEDNGDGEVYAFGAQAEAGSYATSYIPTYGTSVTFESDSAINQANSNLPTEYPFTLFAEFKVTPASEGQALTLSNTASGTEYFSIDFRAGFYRIVSRPSTTLVTVTSTLATTIGLHKICGVFTSTTLKLFVDGTLVGSGANTQAFNASINDIFIGQLRSVSDTGNRNPVKQALVFKSALTDEEAIALTTI